MRAEGKDPPAEESERDPADATVRIADWLPQQAAPNAVVVQEQSSDAAGAQVADSCLIRVRDGQVAQVIDPRGGLLPEQRYQWPEEGQGELGKGGIGQVHLVFDSVLGREVAMKALREDFRRGDPEAVERDREATWRFMREARVTGQLEHPNIVPVYELGRRADGTLYYTMRAVRGRTLGEALRQATTLNARLALIHHFADVCQAIGYAHSRGVLHRDIKPENVMVGEYGETFVLDWGLARIALRPDASIPGPVLSLPPNAANAHASPLRTVTYDDQECTSMGSVVGTPQYMSPEQITGPSDAVDARSDVWSLGVVLYQVLTGQAPFRGKTLADILTQVLAGSIVRPASLEPNVPAELEAIALRALERNKADRYRDAGGLAKDILAYQSGARVAAYAYGSLDLLHRFYARHRAAVRVATFACAALVAVAVSSYLRVTKARDNALRAEQRAIAGQQLANLRYADVLVEKARGAIAIDDVVDAKIYAAEALRIADLPEARGVLIGLSNAVELVPLARFRPKLPCTTVVAGPAANELVCASQREFALYRDGEAIWTAAVPEASSVTALGGANLALFSTDRRWASYRGADGRRYLDGESPLPTATVLAGAARDSWLAAADPAGNVVAWDAGEPNRLPYKLKWGQGVNALAFAKNHHALLIGGSFGRLAIWEFQRDPAAEWIGDTHSTVESIALGPRDTVAVVGGSDGSVSLWDSARHQQLSTVMRRGSAVSSLALSVDGRWLVTGTRAQEVDLIDLQRRDRVFSMPSALGGFRPIGFGEDGRLWLMHQSSELAAFALSEPKPKARMLDRGNVLGLTWSPAADMIYSGGLRESGVCVFRVGDGACTDRLPVRATHLRAIGVSPNGKYLVFAGTGKTVQVWDATARLPLSVVDVPIDEVRAVVFESQPDRAFVAGNSSEVLRLELREGKIVERFGIDGQTQAMALSPDGQTLLIGLRDGRIQLRNTRGELLKEGRAHADWVTGVSWGPRGDFAVSVGGDGMTAFWRIPGLELITARREHQGRATAVAVSGDGRVIATAGEDRRVSISDGQIPWKERASLQGHLGTVRCLAFDPQGRWLASGGDDAVVRLWDLQSLDVEAAALGTRIGSKWRLKLQGATIVTQDDRDRR